MVHRRTLLGGAAAALGTALAGCLGGPVASFAASPATVPDAALRRAGYSERSVDEQVISQGFGPARRAVEVRNWVAVYERPLAPSLLDGVTGTATGGDQPVAVFAALSTPKVRIAGQEFNPVAGFSANDIVERVQGVYGALREVERVDERAVTVLDTAVRVVEYRAAGEVRLGNVGTNAGGTADLTLHVSDPVEHGEDFVVAIAVHPAVAAIERATVDSLLERVEHEEPASD